MASSLRAEAVATPEAAIVSWRHLVSDPEAPAAGMLPAVSMASEIAGRVVTPRDAREFLTTGEPYAIGVVGDASAPGESARALAPLFAVQAESPSVRWLIATPSGGNGWHDDAEAAFAALSGTAPSRDAIDGRSLLERSVRELIEAPVVRRALVLPVDRLAESDAAWRDQVFRAGIALFPLCDARATLPPGLLGLVAHSGGRVLRWQGEPPPLDRAFASLIEFMSGEIVTFSYPHLYRLPWEGAPELRVRLSSASGDLELRLFPPLRGAAASEILSPSHWRAWIATPGRERYGWTAFGAALVSIGLALAAVVRRGASGRVPVAILQELPAGREVEIRSFPCEIGRSRSADLVLADDSVSRSHARLLLESNQLVIEDLASRNGTWVDSEPVQRKRLGADQRVTLGEVTFRIRYPVR